MKKLVIFDHDGLMVNSETIVFKSLNDIFKKYEYDFSWDYFIKHLGMSVVESLKIFYKDFPLPISFEEFYDLRNKTVDEFNRKNLKLMPGLIPILKSIQKKEINMAVSTSGKRNYIDWSLNKFQISNYFASVVCIEDVKKGKPNPDLVLKCLETTKTKPSEAIMIEDAPNGIAASKKAGVFSIAIPSANIDLNKFSEADAIFPNLKSLKQFLDFLL